MIPYVLLSTGNPLTDSAGGNNMMGTNMSGLMGTAFSDTMATDSSGATPKHSAGAASVADGPYGYGHPKYDPHLQQRNPLARGSSNEHLLKGQSGEYSDALAGSGSGGQPAARALAAGRASSGAAEANKWAVSSLASPSQARKVNFPGQKLPACQSGSRI